MLSFLKRTVAARGRTTPRSHPPGRSNPSVLPVPEPGFDVPRYPPADPGLPVVPAAAVVASQRELLARLRELCGFDDTGFADHVMAPIEAVARCIHLLPASSHEHFAGPGGLFRLCLEMALFSRQAAQAHLVAPAASAEVRRALEPRWRHACLLAGLLSELPRPLSSMVVTDEAGRVWPACLGGLEPWLQRVQADRYHVAWLDRPTHGASGGEAAAVLGDLVPKATLSWLNEGSPALVPALFRAALGPPGVGGGDGAEGMGRLLQATRLRVLEVEAVTRRSRYGRLRIGHHLELHLVDAMRHRVATGQWGCGRAPLWWGLDGLFLEWPAAADTVRHDVIRNGVRGVPLCAFTLAEVLGHSGLLVAAAPGQWLWRIQPEDGDVPRVAMKFTDPRAVLGHTDGVPLPRVFAQPREVPAPVSVAAEAVPPPGLATLTPAEVRMVDTWRTCLEAGRRDLALWLPGRGLAVSQDLLALSGADVASVATAFERRHWLGQGDWASPSARAGVLPFDGAPKPGLVLNATGLAQLGLAPPSP